jgi:hypothetical protein
MPGTMGSIEQSATVFYLFPIQIDDVMVIGWIKSVDVIALIRRAIRSIANVFA